ncbi:MAG: sulfocyanin-like copper-binding protein [Sulfobacillus sp.]
MRFRTRWGVVLGLAGFGLFAAGCGAQTTYTPPTFPPGNAVAGEQLYTTTCAACHGPTAEGTSSVAPPLWQQGGVSSPNYSSMTTLTAFIYQNMPKSAPGSLSKQQAADVATFVWGLDGKLGSSTASQMLGMLTKTSAPPPAAPTTTVTSSKFLSVNTSAKTATLSLIAGYNTSNDGGFNFDGGYDGNMTVTIPVGYNVTVNFKNSAQIPHSAAVIGPTGNNATGPIISGATTPNPVLGTAPGGTATFSFTPTKAGSYRIACLFPGHLVLGMYINLKVVSSGTPSMS